MDVQSYLDRKLRDRRRAEQKFCEAKEEALRKKRQAFQDPDTKDKRDAYYVTLPGNKKVDLKDPRHLVNKEVFDQLTHEEQAIYEEAHAKAHWVTVGGKRVDLKDKTKTISRIQYDQLSREDKQIYLVAHPRNKEKADSAFKITPDLAEYLDQKYSTGKCGFEKLNKSAFKWT